MYKDCKKRTTMGVDRIPSINEATEVFHFYYVPENGKSIFYLIDFKEDCSYFSFKMDRISKTILVEHEDVINLNLSSIEYFIRSKEPIIKIRIRLSGAPHGLGVIVYYNEDTFQYGENKYLKHNDTVEFYSSNLKPKYFYIIIVPDVQTYNYTISFETFSTLTPVLNTPITIYRQPLDPDTTDRKLIYYFPSNITCICIETNSNNIALDKVSITITG